MEDFNQQDNDAIVDDKKVYGNPTKAVPVPQPDVGLEETHSVVNDILAVSDQSQINTSVINSFLDVSKRRDRQYDMIDQMCDDSIPSAILEQYTEDATATNDDGKVVWITSDENIIQKACTYILDSFQVNDNIYKWANSMIKYGDVYLKLFRKSEYNDDPIFGNKEKDKKLLKEDINVHINKENDHFVNYAEMVDNPATSFELVRFGKTAGFIKTHIQDKDLYNENNTQILTSNSFKYSFNQSDVDIYQQNQFVHGCLEDNVDRVSEEVEIIREDPTDIDEKKETKVNYKVKNGRSVFYGAFKIWRILSLLETSLILSRLTKSSITRVVQVEVGNIDKNEARPLLQSFKQMIEQKTAINPGKGMAEYNNPGPLDNIIYTTTKNGQGAITTSQIGGDYDPKQLTDLDYFKNAFYGAFGIPKQFFGDTDDGAGFNGGQSLTIISSKYAKKIIKIQAALCKMIKTLINIILIDRGLSKYINKFTVNMLKPITQEDIDRTEAESNKFRVVSDTLSMFSDIETKSTRLKILKAFLPEVTDNSEVIDIVDQEIARLEETPETNDTGNNEDDFGRDDLGGSDNEPLNLDSALGLDELDNLSSEEETGGENTETPEESGPSLPTPGETGVDLVNGTGEEEI